MQVPCVLHQHFSQHEKYIKCGLWLGNKTSMAFFKSCSQSDTITLENNLSYVNNSFSFSRVNMKLAYLSYSKYENPTENINSVDITPTILSNGSWYPLVLHLKSKIITR